jgi:hypothetical protein
VGLYASPNQQGQTVQSKLVGVFETYGLPRRVLVDNGPPWGDRGDQPYTRLGVWLMRLGIGVSHGRPYHPQTQGKEERFHRTLEAEVLKGRTFLKLSEVQDAFDAWRDVYNISRPHQAIKMATPVSKYKVSPRLYPETLPPLEYGPEDLVRKVQDQGRIDFRGRRVNVSKAFRGELVAFRPTERDGVWDIIFHIHRIATIDERDCPKS